MTCCCITQLLVPTATVLTHPETHPAANAQSQSIQRFNHQATTGSNNPSGRECSSSGVCCNPCPPLFFNPDCLLSDSNHPRPICNYNTVTTGRQRAHCVCVTCVVLSHTHTWYTCCSVNEHIQLHSHGAFNTHRLKPPPLFCTYTYTQAFFATGHVLLSACPQHNASVSTTKCVASPCHSPAQHNTNA